jgi:uncharacterized membrane protein YdjX (TVP38/TMEM64 family)
MDDASRPVTASPWRYAPIAIVAAVAVAGFVLFGDRLSFAALAAHRADLIAFRDAHYLPAVLLFVAAYAGIVAFSLPGATIATLAGGFLFGLFPGVAFNVVAATLGRSGFSWPPGWALATCWPVEWKPVRGPGAWPPG